MHSVRKVFVLTWLLIIFLCGAQATHTYHHEEPNTLPNDISFCIADLKFDGTTIQICEFGEGLESRFKGYDAITYTGAMWDALWHALGSYKTPIWVIENSFWQQHSNEYAKKTLTENYGSVVRAFGQVLYKMRVRNPSPTHGIAKPAGIVIIHSSKSTTGLIEHTAQQHPEFLFLGRATTKFVRDKQETNALFNTPFLQEFKPQNLLIKKEYHHELANNILQIIPSDYVVIKPVNSSLGNGIIIIHRNQLNETLKLILPNQNTVPTSPKNSSYAYWARDNNSHFIIEAFAQSKTLVVDGATYDPTMRAAFVISNLHGHMQITHLGSYWKLPAQPLDAVGDFTEQHKSATTSHPGSSIPVDTNDYATVCRRLNNLLPVLYAKMLAST
jgi:hypothetical protein